MAQNKSLRARLSKLKHIFPITGINAQHAIARRRLRNASTDILIGWSVFRGEWDYFFSTDFSSA